MNLLKITLSVVAVFLISISVPTLRTPATATEKKPLDVHLTIETKEIDINEIPDDRIVYLGISIDNAPPFKGLTMYLDKDTRLKFGEPKPFKPAEGAQNIGSINVISHEKAPDILGCGVPAKGTKMIDHSGVLIMTELILPEDVRAGDFYYVKFSPYLVDSYMVIDLSIFPDDRYGLDSFTQLNNGGIRITEKAPPTSTTSSSASSTTSSTPVSTASTSTVTASSTTSSTPVSTASTSTATASSTTSSKPVSTASSSTTKSSSTTSSIPVSTASSSTTKSSSTTSSIPVSTASSSTTKSSSTTSSAPASTASSSTTKSSSTTSSAPASTASSSTTKSSSTTSSAPASTASSSTAATSSMTSSAPASTASALTAADSSVSSTSSSVPEATSDNKEDPESKNGFPIIAGLIALGVIALSLTAVFLVRAKRKK